MHVILEYHAFLICWFWWDAAAVIQAILQGHLAPVKSADGVEAVMNVLLSNRKVASATHNIMAYRISALSKTQEPIVSSSPSVFLFIREQCRRCLVVLS